MLGTPSYMSPEQFMGQTVDLRTDIYSSGVMLYQLLTGEKPFEGGLTAIMHKVLNTEPPPPSALSVNVPQAFDSVVQRAMAKRPQERFGSAGEFARALRDAFENKVAAGLGMIAEDASDDDATIVAGTRTIPMTAQAAAAKPVSSPGQTASKPAQSKKPLPVALLGGIGAGGLLAAGVAAYFMTSHTSAPPTAAVSAPPATIPAAAPAMTAAQRQSILSGTLASLPCTFLNGTDGGTQPSLTGLAGAGAPQAALTAAINSLPPNIVPASSVQTVDGPYCDALNAIRPYHDFFGKPAMQLKVSLDGGATVLHDGDLITVDNMMPQYAGYLETDYFSGDGTVFHLYPTATDALKLQPANSIKVLGDPTKGGASWQISAPYGTDLVISIATSSPLFSVRRPQDENASDYLPALRAALQNAASSGQNLSVAAIQVITQPKQ
jgi:serine/threonine-protein kinase